MGRIGGISEVILGSGKEVRKFWVNRVINWFTHLLN